MGRDVYADFGPLDVDGITLSAPDGQHVLFDQIYLARTVDDFRFLPEPPPSNLADEQAAAIAEVQRRVVLATVTIDFGEGRIGGGTLISGDGDVLTAGHLVVAPNRPVRVTLADGRTVEAQTKGICRDVDAGLVKITVPGPFPAVEIENFSQLDPRGVYCALIPPVEPAADHAPSVVAARVRRLVGAQLWTDVASPNGLPGTGLTNRWGKLVGVHAGRSNFGGALYGVLINAQAFVGRLRNGEVWGRWLRAASPATGLTLTTSSDGLKIHAVAADSPAASSGLQPGDIIVRIDGKPAQVPDDLVQAVAEKNPGATISIEFRRAPGGGTVNVGLSPPRP
jgi:S1-C subfamily serine protease